MLAFLGSLGRHGLGPCLRYRPATRIGLLALGALCMSAHAEDTSPRLHLHGYGTVNYHAFDWQTDPSRRARLDLERIALETQWRLAEGWVLLAELEIEHGGTGSTLEFDRFEEFGEFETEIEKGGEVQIEQFEVDIRLGQRLTLQVGHLFVPVGLAYTLDEPTDYFTVLRSEAETALLPSLWHETGLGFTARFGSLSAQGVLVNGLDGSAFSSANWIARGHQGRFEGVNADNLALALRVDWQAGENLLGISAYGGNTRDNRPKPDLHVPAYVGLYEVHAQLAGGPWLAHAFGLHGFLQNADAVSRANRQLSNNLGVKRTPVGSQAVAAFAEGACDLATLWHRGFTGERHAEALAIWLFGRFDFYDTMFRTEGDLLDNPRWERKTVTAGLNVKPQPHFVVKGEIAQRWLGTASLNHETTYAAGFGVVF